MSPGTRESPVRIQRVRDAEAQKLAVAAEVRQGLLSSPRSLPSKLFYDDRGGALFEAITELPEYYLTRTETRLLESRADEIVDVTKPRELVELGAGAGRKIRLLLDAMQRQGRAQSCVLLDVHEGSLLQAADRLTAAYPQLGVRCIAGDFITDLAELGPGGGRMILFLAGTIGNLDPEAVPAFLRRVRCQLTLEDSFLVGFDLIKDPAELHAAYNDAAGITARFNLNMLQALNDGLGADFPLDAFEHEAFYVPAAERIEMWLRATRELQVHVPGAGLELRIAAGEAIRSEISCKYTRPKVEALLEGTGLSLGRWIADPDERFALALLLPN